MYTAILSAAAAMVLTGTGVVQGAEHADGVAGVTQPIPPLISNRLDPDPGGTGPAANDGDPVRFPGRLHARKDTPGRSGVNAAEVSPASAWPAARAFGLLGVGVTIGAVIGSRDSGTDWRRESAWSQPDESIAAAVREDPRYRFINDHWIGDDRFNPGGYHRPSPFDLMGLSYAHAAGYLGRGVIITVLDDTFQMFANNGASHPVFAGPGKVVDLFNAMEPAFRDPHGPGDMSHGTHVAGLAAGNSDVMIGVAPEAQIYLASNAGIAMEDFNALRWADSFLASTAVGARVHTNSWGWDEVDVSGPDGSLVRAALDTRRVLELIRDPQAAIARWQGTRMAYLGDYFTRYAIANGLDLQDYAGNPGLALESYFSWAIEADPEMDPFEGFQDTDWDHLAGSMKRFQTDGDGVILFALSNYRLRDTEGELYADASASFAELYPELQDAWLTVANVNVTSIPGGEVAAVLMSSGCHQTARYCLSHNGTQVNSAVPLNAYEAQTGTSMATPQVAGAVAVLAEAFPGHSGSQLANRLLATASNFNDWQDVQQTGDHWYGLLTLPDGSDVPVRFAFFDPDGPIAQGPGEIGEVDFGNGVTHAYSEIFGHGFVDLAAALRPVGVLDVPLGASVQRAARAPLEASRFRFAPAFGDAPARALEDRRMVALDALDGAFQVPLHALSRSAVSGHGLHDLLHGFGRSRDVTHFTLGEDTYLQTGLRRDRFADVGPAGASWSAEADGTRLELAEFSLRHDFSDHVSARLDLHRNPATHLGLQARGLVVPGNMASQGAFANPLLDFANRGESAGMELRVGPMASIRLGAFRGRDDRGFAIPDRSGVRVRGTVAELDLDIGDARQPLGSVGLELAHLEEGDSILGSLGSGAFEFGRGTGSTTVGLNGTMDLGRWFGGGDWHLVGSTHMALTRPRLAAASVFEDVSVIRSRSFTLGLLGRDLIVDDDRWGLVLSSPLRVERGHAGLRLPVGHDGSSLRHERLHADLTPSGREVRLETYYGRSLSSHVDVQGSLMLRRQPGHVRHASDQGVALLHAGIRF